MTSADPTRQSRSALSGGTVLSRLGARGASLSPRLAAVLVGAACLGVSAYLYAGYRSESRLRDAYQLGVQGHYAAAAVLAGSITTPPARVGAAAVVAYAYLDSGNLTGAGAAFVHAVALAPEDWVLRSDWAVTLRRLGNRARARHQMQVALGLNPLLRLPSGFCAVMRQSGRRVVLC